MSQFKYLQLDIFILEPEAETYISAKIYADSQDSSEELFVNIVSVGKPGFNSLNDLNS